MRFVPDEPEPTTVGEDRVAVAHWQLRPAEREQVVAALSRLGFDGPIGQAGRRGFPHRWDVSYGEDGRLSVAPSVIGRPPS